MADVRKANCQLCGYFCGAKVSMAEDGAIAQIKPDTDRYPYDQAIMGRCRRFAANKEILDHPGRINYPMKRVGIRGSGDWERISWDQALSEIAERLLDLKVRFNAESLATCISAPHTIYWPMHRFLNLWGSPNNIGMGIVCWNPRIWVNTLTCGWPIDDELNPEVTKCVILWGINPAESDRSMFWENLKDYSRQGGNIIAIDPRRTETARLTDTWVSLRPGTDGALALGMLNIIITENLFDEQFVKNWCSGFEALCERVKEYPPVKVSSITCIPEEQIFTIARQYATAKPASIFTGLGIDQSGFNCTQTLRSIALLRAVTGNIDVPGGSLLNDRSDFIPEVELELSHMLSNEQKNKKLGAGLFPLQRHDGYEKMLRSTMLHGKQLPARYMTSTHPDLAWKAMITGKPYPIRALICMASNPLLCQANTKQVYQAIKGLDLLVNLEKFMTPTAMLSDYVLPVTGGFEQSVVQMNGGVANIMYGGGPAIDPMYERRSDFAFWMELGKRCGQKEYWPWDSFENAMNDVLSPAGTTWDEFREVGLYAPEPVYMKYKYQGFATPSGKIELYSRLLAEAGHDPLPAYVNAPHVDVEKDLMLITGVRKQPYYSSEFRQVKSLRNRHPQPHAEMCAETAHSFGLNDGDSILIETAQGRIRHRLLLVDMFPNAVSVELGWWYPEQPAAEPELGGMWEANANVLTSADTKLCDPILGQWSFRSIPCWVYKAVDLAKTVVRTAGAEDREELMALLAANDMDCSAIPVEEFSLLIGQEGIMACVRLEECQDKVLVRPIVVAEKYRGQGVGRHLMNQVLPADKSTILVARGEAVPFYTRSGFSNTSWDEVPKHQLEECTYCPDKEQCEPQPMLRGRS
ncbi:MAG: GNAT family N-acetyltransferase [Desulfuromonadaceae bacterium]|nr:GNAT family N-acetyltransferase [Desulfuromonadaceae bacterium]